MTTRYTVSLSSKALVDDFRRMCKRKGRTQSYVIEQAMRSFVAFPDNVYFEGAPEPEEKPGEKAESGRKRLVLQK
jgi:hypothetical protein